MKVDFLNLKRQYAEIASELEEAVVECLRSGAYIEGPKVKELEEKLAEYLGVSHATEQTLLSLLLKHAESGLGTR